MLPDCKTVSIGLLLILIPFLCVFLCGFFAEDIIEFLANHLPQKSDDRKEEWLAMLDELNEFEEKAHFVQSLIPATFGLIIQSLKFPFSTLRKLTFEKKITEPNISKAKYKNIRKKLNYWFRDYCDRMYLGKSMSQNIQDDPLDIPPLMENKQTKEKSK